MNWDTKKENPQAALDLFYFNAEYTNKVFCVSSFQYPKFTTLISGQEETQCEMTASRAISHLLSSKSEGFLVYSNTS